MHTACGCIPAHCSCGDFDCASGRTPLPPGDDKKTFVIGFDENGRKCECPQGATALQVEEKHNKYSSWCSRWYYSPLGNAEIRSMPNVSQLLPQRALPLDEISFRRDADFADVVGLSHFDRIAITFTGTLTIVEEGSYTVCIKSGKHSI